MPREGAAAMVEEIQEWWMMIMRKGREQGVIVASEMILMLIAKLWKILKNGIISENVDVIW